MAKGRQICGRRAYRIASLVVGGVCFAVSVVGRDRVGAINRLFDAGRGPFERQIAFQEVFPLLAGGVFCASSFVGSRLVSTILVVLVPICYAASIVLLSSCTPVVTTEFYYPPVEGSIFMMVGYYTSLTGLAGLASSTGLVLGPWRNRTRFVQTVCWCSVFSLWGGLAGCLIADDIYKPSLEANRVFAGPVVAAMVALITPLWIVAYNSKMKWLASTYALVGSLMAVCGMLFLIDRVLLQFPAGDWHLMHRVLVLLYVCMPVLYLSWTCPASIGIAQPAGGPWDLQGRSGAEIED